jgi:hypothetical protein
VCYIYVFLGGLSGTACLCLGRQHFRYVVQSMTGRCQRHSISEAQQKYTLLGRQLRVLWIRRRASNATDLASWTFSIVVVGVNKAHWSGSGRTCKVIAGLKAVSGVSGRRDTCLEGRRIEPQPLWPGIEIPSQRCGTHKKRHRVSATGSRHRGVAR